MNIFVFDNNVLIKMAKIYIVFHCDEDFVVPEDYIMGIFTQYESARRFIKNFVCSLVTEEYREEKMKHFDKHFRNDQYVDCDDTDNSDDYDIDGKYYIKCFDVKD